MGGLELERTMSGDYMSWKSFGLPSVTHKALKKENAICPWLSKDLWRLKTLSVLDTDYIERSFLAMCLKTLWHFSPASEDKKWELAIVNDRAVLQE